MAVPTLSPGSWLGSLGSARLATVTMMAVAIMAVKSTAVVMKLRVLLDLISDDVDFGVVLMLLYVGMLSSYG